MRVVAGALACVIDTLVLSSVDQPRRSYHLCAPCVFLMPRRTAPTPSAAGPSAAPPRPRRGPVISSGVDDDEDLLSESDGEEHADDAGEREMGGAGVEDGVAHDMEMDVDAAPLDSSSPDSPRRDASTPSADRPGERERQAARGRPDPAPVAALAPKEAEEAQGETGAGVHPAPDSDDLEEPGDLFVPPYIKDRYVASTSPPGSGFVSTSVSSTNSALTDYDNYEVEVVEIRVQEGEYAGIIPRP
ncbi:hypothetical protein MSAN_00446900 [Mycena sanguinolenta]|uniref:Uncharacterized protein n=1 Tax=Mycena sanguinolenta TaxID=230812 RepID=A0A8H6ZDN9_9AGAR|nr:hypothetical protein MSAN_00446900 [Mycena sanguinolenta]